MKKWKRLICAWTLWMELLILGMLTGCAGGAFYGLSGPDWYGPEYDDFYGDYYYPGYYGSVWGPDAFAFGRHLHGGFDRDFGRRGFMSRGVAGVFHGGGGFRGGGVFHGRGGGGGFRGGGGGGRGGGGHGR